MVRKEGGGYLSKELQDGFHRLFGSNEFINAMRTNLSARSSPKRGLTKRLSRSVVGSGTSRLRSQPLDLNVRLLPPPPRTTTGCTIHPVPERMIRSRTVALHRSGRTPPPQGLEDKREGYPPTPDARSSTIRHLSIPSMMSVLSLGRCRYLV